MSDLRIAVEDTAQLAAFLDIVEEAAAWLWQRGIRQWGPGTNRAQRAHLAKLIERGALVIARSDAAMIGGCTLSERAPPAWEKNAANALYLSKLVVTRAHAGGRVAPRILRFCEAHTRDAGKPQLRLDCWDGNARLRAYYREAGFTELHAATEHGYTVRLFEKAV